MPDEIVMYGVGDIAPDREDLASIFDRSRYVFSNKRRLKQFLFSLLTLTSNPNQRC